MFSFKKRLDELGFSSLDRHDSMTRLRILLDVWRQRYDDEHDASIRRFDSVVAHFQYNRGSPLRVVGLAWHLRMISATGNLLLHPYRSDPYLESNSVSYMVALLCSIYHPQVWMFGQLRLRFDPPKAQLVLRNDNNHIVFGEDLISLERERTDQRAVAAQIRINLGG